MEAREQGGGSGEQVAALADLADHDARPDPLAARGEGELAEQGGQQGRLARAVAAHDRQPVAPRDLERHRPEPEAGGAADAGPLDHRIGQPGHDVTPAAGVGDGQAQVPPFPRLVDRLEPSEGLVGDLRLGRHVLGALHVAVADELVGLARALGSPHALVGPLALGAGPLGEGAALVGVDPVGLLGVLAGESPFVEVGAPSALVAGERVGVVVDLGDRGDRALEERPIVRHDHQRRVEAEDEPLEPVEAVEVEVVGRLVEQEDVEPRQQQAGELGAGGLAAREAGDLAVERRVGQVEVGGHRGDAGVEVGPAQRHPAVEGAGVAVGGGGVLGVQRGGRGVEAGRGVCDPRAPGEHRPHGLTGARVGLLRQVADGGGRRAEAYGPAVGGSQAGQDAQQRRLARPVRPDQPDPGPGREHETDAGQQGPGPGGDVEVAHGECGKGCGQRHSRARERDRDAGQGRVATSQATLPAVTRPSTAFPRHG